MITLHSMSYLINKLLTTFHNHQYLFIIRQSILPDIHRLNVINNITTSNQPLIQQYIAELECYLTRRSSHIENCQFYDLRCQNHFFFIKYIIQVNVIILRMLDRSQKNIYEDLQDLSPWGNQQIEKNSIIINVAPRAKMRKMRSIPPRVKNITQRRQSQKNTIKPTDYILPPVNRNYEIIKQHQSMTIDPPPGRLIRNISSHRLKSTQSDIKLLPEGVPSRFKLSGKKYDMVPQQRISKSFTQQTKSHNNLTNNTMLLLTRKKDDVLKRVLNQIQGRIRQMGI